MTFGRFAENLSWKYFNVMNVLPVKLIRDRRVQLDLIREALKLYTMIGSTN